MQESQFAIVIPAVFVVIGIGLIWFAYHNRKLAKASLAWPSVTGRIIRSQVSQSENFDQENRLKVTYLADVAYEYVVGDQTMQGDRVQFGGRISGGSSKPAQKVVDRYPVGSEITVYYDPVRPNQCTLERTTAGSLIVLYIIGFAFVILAPIIGVVAYGFRE
jgi:hypothetical protein